MKRTNCLIVICFALITVCLLFFGCNRSDKNPKISSNTPVVQKVLPVASDSAVKKVLPVTTDFYGYKKLQSNGKTFWIILELTTIGEKKAITCYSSNEGIIDKNTTRDWSSSTYHSRIEIFDDNTFSKEGKDAINGKIEGNIIKGLVVFEGNQYSFEAETSKVKKCTSCNGTGKKTGSSTESCPFCNGVGGSII